MEYIPNDILRYLLEWLDDPTTLMLSFTNKLLRNITGKRKECYFATAALGYLDIIKWLHEHRFPLLLNTISQAAGMYGQLKIIQYLYKTTGFTPSRWVVLYSDNIEIVEWFIEKSLISLFVIASDAIRINSVNVLKWLLRRGYVFRKIQLRYADPSALALLNAS
jgi:hypothetical protein